MQCLCVLIIVLSGTLRALCVGKKNLATSLIANLCVKSFLLIILSAAAFAPPVSAHSLDERCLIVCDAVGADKGTWLRSAWSWAFGERGLHVQTWAPPTCPEAVVVDFVHDLTCPAICA